MSIVLSLALLSVIFSTALQSVYDNFCHIIDKITHSTWDDFKVFSLTTWQSHLHDSRRVSVNSLTQFVHDSVEVTQITWRTQLTQCLGVNADFKVCTDTTNLSLSVGNIWIPSSCRPQYCQYITDTQYAKQHCLLINCDVRCHHH